MTPDPDAPHRIRVRYAETDQMGLAHHGSYVAWFEEARTEWLRRLGKSYRTMEEEGHLLQVVELQVEYKRAVRFEDEILITTRIAERSKVSIVLAYEVARADDGSLVARGRTRLACVSPEGRLQRLPPELAAG